MIFAIGRFFVFLFSDVLLANLTTQWSSPHWWLIWRFPESELGAPSSHPFLDAMFHRTKPSSYVGTPMTLETPTFYRSTSPRFNKSKRHLGPKLSLPDTSPLLPRIQAERCVDCSEGCPKSVEALRPIQKCCFIIISQINPIRIMVGCQTILIQYIYIYTYHTSSIQLGLQVDANMSSMSKMSSPIPPAPGVADQLQPSTRAGGAVQRPWPQSGRSKVDLIYIYI